MTPGLIFKGVIAVKHQAKVVGCQGHVLFSLLPQGGAVLMTAIF
jgi:hypothetical protein